VRRRNFLAGAFGLPLIGLGHARAQTVAKPLEIGFVYEGIAPAGAVRAKAFQDGLRSRGHDEGRNIVTMIRTAESRPDQFEPLVRELVQRDVKVLFAIGPAVVRLAHAATKSIPIVALDLESDPIRDGLVQNIARPGGNLTGMFFDFPDFARKWLQLLTETVPNLKRLTVFWDTSTGKYQVDAVSDEARTRGISLEILQVASPADFEPSFTAAIGNKAEGRSRHPAPLAHDHVLSRIRPGRRSPGLGHEPDRPVLSSRRACRQNP